jgi:hypothetical protein
MNCSLFGPWIISFPSDLSKLMNLGKMFIWARTIDVQHASSGWADKITSQSIEVSKLFFNFRVVKLI